MATPIDAAQAIADDLAAATGLRVALKPSAMAPPCIAIEPPTVRVGRTLRGCSGGDAMWTAYAVVPGSWNADAWSRLDAMVAAVLAADIVDIHSIDPTSHSTDSSGSCPAMRLSWSAPVDWSPPQPPTPEEHS
jgi:hypothetical protein